MTLRTYGTLAGIALIGMAAFGCDTGSSSNTEAHSGFPLDPALEAAKATANHGSTDASAVANAADTQPKSSADDTVAIPHEVPVAAEKASPKALLEWDAETRRVASALPANHRMREPFLGYWRNQGFHTDADQGGATGLAAVRAAYRSEKTTVGVATSDEAKPFHSLGSMSFEQECELVVIAAGNQAPAIQAEISGVLDGKNWKRGSLAYLQPEGKIDITCWSSDKLTAYVITRGNYVLYALERDGESESGSGASSSLGGQLIIQAIEGLGS